MHALRILHDLDQILHRRSTGDDQPFRLELLDVIAVDLVAMAVPFVDLGATVDARCQRARLQRSLLRAQAHGAALVGAARALLHLAGGVLPLGDQPDHRVRRVEVEFGGMRVFEAANVAGEFDDRNLHAQADTKVGHPVLAGVLRSQNLALDATLTEARAHQNRVHALEHGHALGLDLFRFEVVDVDLAVVVNAAGLERLVDRFVGIDQLDVLAHESDINLVFRAQRAFDDVRPRRQIGRFGQQIQRVADDFIEHLVVQQLRHLEDGVHIGHRNHGTLLDVGEQCDLLLFVLRHRPVGAAQQHIREDADLAQLLHAVLRRLGFQLTSAGDVRHQRQVDVAAVAAPHLNAHLADRFHEGQRLNIAHGAADLDHQHIEPFTGVLDLRLDFVGDVRNHLHRATKVVAAALLIDHVLVDLAGRKAVARRHLSRHETLVMAEVEISFGTILGHIYLTVLIRAHGARIDVDVGIEFDEGDFEAARFKNRGERGGGDAFSEGRHHPAGHEHVFGHG